MNSQTVNCISECFIKPQQAVTGDSSRVFLSPWDLAMLSVYYIQKGLLFIKPPGINMSNYLDRLKESLSTTLDHFYPLAGRLWTKKEHEPRSYVVFIDCNKGPGAKFIHAKLDMTISDILSPVYVPVIVRSFFDHDRVVNHDGHERSLLSIQVTELIDGIFIGCSMNHAVADGTSFWHFLNMWSEIFQAQGKISISRPPIHTRWFPDGHGPIINLPFSHHDEFISRCEEAPELRERMFHFSSDSIAKLKAKANADCNTTKISSFQALSAVMWRTITRARGLPDDREINCKLSINNRSRLNPPLSPNLFGNSIQSVRGVTRAGELLEHNLGWAAWKLHRAVNEHSDQSVRSFLDRWMKSPLIYQADQFFNSNSVMMTSSPRFDMYRNEYGLGKAVALRSGYARKFDGKVSAYPGYEGGGSVDLEICLPPKFMTALEHDAEFLDAVSTHQISP